MGRSANDRFNKLGQLIKKKRLEAKLSVADVCKKIGRENFIHKVYAIEAGEYYSRLPYLIEVILAVGCTEDELREIGFKEKFENNPRAKEILAPLLDVL